MEGKSLKMNAINKLEAFEMWLYRRIPKIPKTERLTNGGVLKYVSKEHKLFAAIKKREKKHMWDTSCKTRYPFLLLMIEDKIEGKRGIGR